MSTELSRGGEFISPQHDTASAPKNRGGRVRIFRRRSKDTDRMIVRRRSK